MSNKKSPGNYCPGCKSVVPRDRIELPTRGFSVTTSEFPNLLKLLQATEIVIFNFLHLFRFLPILADFGKFFSHRFSHSQSHLFIYLTINSSDNQRPMNCNSFAFAALIGRPYTRLTVFQKRKIYQMNSLFTFIVNNLSVGSTIWEIESGVITPATFPAHVVIGICQR
jgi:hypothetical protein